MTVSAFLQANLLDRLQIAIAPVIIGDGRPAIRLAPHARLRDCRRRGIACSAWVATSCSTATCRRMQHHRTRALLTSRPSIKSSSVFWPRFRGRAVLTREHLTQLSAIEPVEPASGVRLPDRHSLGDGG